MYFRQIIFEMDLQALGGWDICILENLIQAGSFKDLV